MPEKPKKKFIEIEGKKWDLSQFDDTRSWEKIKKPPKALGVIKNIKRK